MKKVKIELLSNEFFEYSEDCEIPLVQKIIVEVKRKGDKAVRKFTNKYDRVDIEQFIVEKKEIKRAYSFVSREILTNIEEAVSNVKDFSFKQLEAYKDFEFEIKPGVYVGQRILPLGRVGVYVPAGRYPLISSLIMGAIPAKTVGVSEVVVCSPPSHSGSVNPAILVAADISGVDEIYRVGGAQAIAAMAYGTQSIREVDKIVGPGNSFVNAAKKAVYGRVGIDFIAGPTEIVIIAEKGANPSFIASDLIAQAEHDINAKPVLVTDSDELAEAVRIEIERELKLLQNVAVAEESLKHNGMILIVHSMDEAIEFTNRRAPEHLELHLKNSDQYITKLKNYGSLFIGQYSSEALGDYSSGLNHILPTNFASRYTGGLSVKDFIKIQTQLKVNRKGFLQIGPIAQGLAEAEGLYGHALSVSLRMKSI